MRPNRIDESVNLEGTTKTHGSPRRVNKETKYNTNAPVKQRILLLVVVNTDTALNAIINMEQVK